MCAPPELRFVGITEFWAARFEEAERHLDEGVTLARRIGRPFLEFSGLVYQAGIELFRSFTRAAERSRQAIDLAERQGWTDDPVRSARGDRRARAGPGWLRPRGLAVLAGCGLPAGGNRPGRARRPSRRRARPRARARSGRTRRQALVV